MSSSSFHILIYSWLQPLLQRLRDKGLPVSPDAHIQVLKVLQYCGEKINDGDSLFHYLSPVLAKNAEQVKLLEGEIRSFLEEQFPQPPLPIDDDKKDDKKGGDGRTREIWIGVTIALAAIAIILFLAIPRAQSHVDISAISVQSTNYQNPVTFDALGSFSKISDTQHVKFTWNFGDGTIDSSGYKVQHTYIKPGNYAVSVKVQKGKSPVKILKADSSWQLAVCPRPVIIENSIKEVEIGQTVSFSLDYDSLNPPARPNTWYVNDVPKQRNSYAFSHSFESAGVHWIGFSPDSQKVDFGVCNTGNKITVVVKSPQSLMVDLAGNNELPEPKFHVRSSWFWLFGLLVIGPGLIVLYIKARIAKKDRVSKKNVNNLIEQFGGRGAPWEIPFKNQDELIEDEKGISQLSKLYKRRSQAETFYLNIPQTISSTIRSEGLLQPVYSSSSRPLEFLILIDRTRIKSQQVKLFEYLVSKFSRNDIYLEKFYFQSTPEICTNAHYPNGIHISRLHDLYAGHTLILFGTGYQFLDPHYPSLKDSLVRYYKKWTNRAICTPVSYSDWNYREDLLQKAGAVFPADLKGQLLLFRVLEQSDLLQDDFRKYIDDAYEVKPYNFGNTAQLKKYLNDPFLYQWLCAMAVYPHIDWNVMVAIGDAIQAAHFRHSAVNYSTLLRLVRISWMTDGTWPDNMRLELLKDLDPAYEKTARETMVRILEEVAQKIKPSSSVYEIVQTQLIINKFLLHAHAPGDEQYRDYAQEVARFKNLWEQDKIMDTTLATYLKKPAGAAGWSTLISNEGLSDNPGESLTIDAYLKDGIHVIKKKFRPAQTGLLGTSIFSAAVLVLLLTTATSFRNSGVDKWLGLTVSNNQVTTWLQLAFNNCLDSTRMRTDSTRFIIRLPDGRQKTLDADNTRDSIDMPYHWKDSLVALSVVSKNTEYKRDTVFGINLDELTLSISGCPPPVPSCTRWTDYSERASKFQSDYAGDWYDALTAPGKDSSVPFHIEPGYINGKKIVEMYSCPNDVNNYKAILDNEDGAFEVVYMQTGQSADNLSFAFINNRFASRSAARNDESVPQTSMRQRFGREASVIPANRAIATLQGSWYLTGDTPNNTDAFKFAYQNNSPVLSIEGYVLNIAQTEYSLVNGNIPFYAFSFRYGGRPTGKMYVVQLDDTKLLMSEEIAAPFKNINRATTSMGIFHPLSRDKSRDFVRADISELPPALSEIWHGGGDRLRTFNFDLNKRTIYYNLSTQKDFSFNITQVYRRNNIFKLVSVTREGMRVMFIRNVTRQSFELAFCETLHNTQAEVDAIDESSCQFVTTGLYYEPSANRIYLPADGNNYDPDQSRKLEQYLPSQQQQSLQGGTAVDSIKVYVNSNTAGAGNLKNRYDQIQKNSPLNMLEVPWTFTSFGGSYYQRDYLEIKAKPAVPQPNCNATYNSIDETLKLSSPLIVCRLNLSSMRLTAIPREIFSFTNLQYLNLGETTIPDAALNDLRKRFGKLDLQYSRPAGEIDLGLIEFKGDVLTANGLSKVREISTHLIDNRNARIRIEGFYYRKEDRKALQLSIDKIRDIMLNAKPAPLRSQVMDKLSDAGGEQPNGDYTAIRIYGIDYFPGAKANTPSKSN